jgi:hypothetical protein
MLGAILRILIGFIVACLVAGVATVAFVITPADIATLPADLRPERLASAGVLSLLAATHSAIFALPFALIAVAIAEWQAIRSWIYYVIAGIAIALGGFGAEYLSEVGGQPSIVNDYAARAFLTVGFLGGLAYWLVAGRSAGGKGTGGEAVTEPSADEDGEPPAAEKTDGKLAEAAG